MNLAALKEAPVKTRKPCVVGRWRMSLDEDNRDVFDELVERVRDENMPAITLWRGLAENGLDCSAESLRRYIRKETLQPTEIEDQT